jgi:hypothetical protein
MFDNKYNLYIKVTVDDVSEGLNLIGIYNYMNVQRPHAWLLPQRQCGAVHTSISP